MNDPYLTWLRDETARAETLAVKTEKPRDLGYRDALRTALEVYESHQRGRR